MGWGRAFGISEKDRREEGRGLGYHFALERVEGEREKRRGETHMGAGFEQHAKNCFIKKNKIFKKKIVS